MQGGLLLAKLAECGRLFSVSEIKPIIKNWVGESVEHTDLFRMDRNAP